MIRVILVDDHEIVRSAIKLTLKDAKDIEIVAEAKTGEEAVSLTKRLKPDIVLMDMNMPGTDGFSASMQLLQNTVPVKILIISSQESDVLQPRLLQRGISGYISKNAAPETLKEAIRAVHAGKKFFVTTTPTPTNSPFTDLSDRELQITLMIAKGMESQEIAERLFLSKKTIHGYHRDLLKKLGVKKDVDLTRLAIKYGLIDLDSV